MKKISSLIFLSVLLFSIFNMSSIHTKNGLGSPKTQFAVNSNPSSNNYYSPHLKIQNPTVTQFTNIGLPFPLEGELNSYNRLQTVQALSQLGAKITDIELDTAGNIYVLGNYNTTLFNFTQTGLNTLGFPITFTKGTPSKQSSFILVYSSSNTFLYGKELDFDNNFDYYFVSMQQDGANFVLLAEKRPVLNFTPQSIVDITVFKYISNFSTNQNATYGGVARETLGVPSDYTYGIKNIPSHLLKIDSQGNIFVAGMTRSIDFGSSNTKNSALNYGPSYLFIDPNLSNPLYYPDLSFSNSWSVQNSALTANASTNTLNFTNLLDTVQLQSNNPNLMGYWSFDENAYNFVTDGSGNGINGVINGATWAPGYYDSGLNFSGVDQNVTIPSSTFIQFGNNNFTVSTWIKTLGTPQTSIILSKGNNQYVSADEYSLSLQTGGHIGYGIGNGTVNNFGVSNLAVNDGYWQLITMVVDGIGGNISLYINGSLDSYYTRTITSSPITDPLTLGTLMGYSTFNDYSFNGTIDDVRIYNKSLSTSEISNLYSNNYPTITATILDSAGNTLNVKTVSANGVNTPLLSFSTATPNIKTLIVKNGAASPAVNQFYFTNLVIQSHAFDNTTNNFESFNGPANEAITTKIPGVTFTQWVAADLTGNILAPHSGKQAIYPYPFGGINLISFDKPTSYVSFYTSITSSTKTVYFQDVDNKTLRSIVLPIGNNTFIEFGVQGPEIKSMFFTNIASYGISVDDFSFAKSPSYSTNDFESFNGPANEPIDNKIQGVTFHNWKASNPISQVTYHSGQNAIWNVAQDCNITFDNPVSLVSFYYSFYNFGGGGGFNQQYTIYFLSDNGTKLGSMPFTYSNNTYLSFTTPIPQIKTLIFIAWNPYLVNGYAWNDLLIDDFSFWSHGIFVLKLNNDLSYNTSTVLSDKEGQGYDAVTSIVLDNANNVFVSGISTAYFESNGTATAYQTLNFQSTGTGFITSFNTSLQFLSLTTIGNPNHSAIYSMFYNNSKLYVGGQSLASFAQSYWNPNILLSVYQPSNGSGLLAEFSPSNWNLLYYRSMGDPAVPIDGSAITDIEVQSNYIYYEGLFNVTSSQSKFANKGPFSTGNTTGLIGDNVPFIGILNSTNSIAFTTLLRDEVNTLSPMIVDQTTGEIYYVDANGQNFYVYSYLDTDGDGLSDYNEINIYHTDPNAVDTDADGLSDGVEVYKYHTDPTNPDTDGDCINDGLEIKYGTNPLYPDANVDTDGDGLTLLQEIQAGTDPNKVDTDGDGLTDYQEFMIYHTNGNNSDTDGDGLSDYTEIFVTHTSPLTNDTDGDGLSDSFEVNTNVTVCTNGTVAFNVSNIGTYGICETNKTNPLSYDSDLDGISDYTEIYHSHTMPWRKDSDGDGLSDYQEYVIYLTNGLNIDSDGDGLNDTYEILISHTDPNKADTDGDGLTDGQEILIYHTNPLVNDTDGDGLSDGFEVFTSHTDPLQADADHDGLNDKIEYQIGTNSTNPDTDGDGMPDGYEYQYMNMTNISNGLNPLVNDSYKDFDKDNLTNIQEMMFGTNPLKADTDNDNLSDYNEVMVYHTNPLNNDTDSDGLTDGSEVYTYHTDPLLADTDGDNLTDGVEVLITHSNPLKADTDGDGLGDYQEFKLNTSLTRNDTDYDNLTDFYEVYISHTNPLKADSDNDGLNDSYELQIGTDPNNPDSDFDNLSDKLELSIGTNPLSADSDNDGLSDGQEYLVYKTNPLINDTDKDGLSDGQEVNIYHTDPLKADTDGDGMPDGWEIKYGLNPLKNDANEDPDHDGLTNLQEYKLGTDPTNPDTNNDGIPDGQQTAGSNALTPLGSNDNSIDHFINGAEKDPLATLGVVGSMVVAIVITVQQYYTRKIKGE